MQGPAINVGDHEFSAIMILEADLWTDPERVGDSLHTSKSVVVIDWYISHDISDQPSPHEDFLDSYGAPIRQKCGALLFFSRWLQNSSAVNVIADLPGFSSNHELDADYIR